MRRTPMPRSKKSVKPRNPKRRAKEFARAYGLSERVEFVKSLPCCVANSECAGVIENMHVRGGGAGRKANAESVAPGCSFHHAELHAIGVASFTMKYAVDLDHEARRTAELWEGRGRRSEMTPLSAIVPHLEAGQLATCDPAFQPEIVE
jgi:hypothetical protein